MTRVKEGLVVLPEEVKLYLRKLNDRYDNRLHEEILFNIDLDEEIQINTPVSLGMNILHILANSALPDSVYSNIERDDLKEFWRMETIHLIDIINTLLNLGADINALSVDGQNALDYALISLNARVVNHLLDKRITLGSPNMSAISTLETAKRLNHHGLLSDSLLEKIFNLSK